MYIGAKINEAPTPNPPTIRATTKNQKLVANAEPTAEMAYKMAAYLKTVLLPIRSLRGPAVIMAKVAVRVNDATDQPNSSLVKSNSGSINRTTPDMTEASNPIKSPPSATIRAIIIIMYLFDFMGFGDIGYD